MFCAVRSPRAVDPLLDPCEDPAGQTALLDACKLVANKASATQQIALCGEADQQAGVHMLEKLAAQLKPTVTRLVKNGTTATGVGILKFLHEHCPPDTFDANSAKAALLTEEGMVHMEPQVPGQGSMHDQVVTWALCMKEVDASALENQTAKSHMPGTATTLKTIMNRALEVKGMCKDKTCVQKMNEQAQSQNCTAEQLLDHVVQGDKSRLHDVHSNDAVFSTTGSHGATPKHEFTPKELEQAWASRHKCVDTHVLAHFPNKAVLHTDKCNNCKLAGHRKCVDVNGVKTPACLAAPATSRPRYAQWHQSSSQSSAADPSHAMVEVAAAAAKQAAEGEEAEDEVVVADSHGTLALTNPAGTSKKKNATEVTNAISHTRKRGHKPCSNKGSSHQLFLQLKS